MREGSCLRAAGQPQFPVREVPAVAAGDTFAPGVAEAEQPQVAGRCHGLSHNPAPANEKYTNSARVPLV